MSGQDYDKDLYIVLVGSGESTLKNFVDNMEDYIFGNRDEREATLLVPYTKDLSSSLGRVLNDWAVGDDEEPNYPIRAFVQGDNGHKSVAKSKKVLRVEEPHGVAMESAAVEAAMEDLLTEQSNGNEVVVVVLYDEEKDVDLVGSIKNYNSIPVLNLDGMVDTFPGFKTTDEILKEERDREAFEAEEAIRIAAEKEQEKAVKAAAAPAKKAAAPRKRAATTPTEKPLTEAPAKKAAAPRKKAVAPKPVEDPNNGVNRGFIDQTAKEMGMTTAEYKESLEHKVGDTVIVAGIPFTKHSELPSELEPVKDLTPKPTVEQYKAAVASGALVPEDLPSPEEVPDLWKDVSKARAEVSVSSDKLVVSKESMAQLGEGIKEMALAYAKTIDALTTMVKE